MRQKGAQRFINFPKVTPLGDSRAAAWRPGHASPGQYLGSPWGLLRLWCCFGVSPAPAAAPRARVLPTARPALLFPFWLLLGTTQQKNKVLEIVEADDLKKKRLRIRVYFLGFEAFKFQVWTVGPGRCILALVHCQELGVSSTEEWFKSNLSLSTPKWTLPQ